MYLSELRYRRLVTTGPYENIAVEVTVAVNAGDDVNIAGLMARSVAHDLLREQLGVQNAWRLGDDSGAAPEDDEVPL